MASQQRCLRMLVPGNRLRAAFPDFHWPYREPVLRAPSNNEALCFIGDDADTSTAVPRNHNEWCKCLCSKLIYEVIASFYSLCNCVCSVWPFKICEFIRLYVYWNHRQNFVIRVLLHCILYLYTWCSSECHILWHFSLFLRILVSLAKWQGVAGEAIKAPTSPVNHFNKNKRTILSSRLFAMLQLPFSQAHTSSEFSVSLPDAFKKKRGDTRKFWKAIVSDDE